MKFIDDAHKKFSVWAAGIFGTLAFAYDYVPAIHDYLPDGWAKFAIALILFARIIKQESCPPK